MGNQGEIKECEPHNLQNLSISFSNLIDWVFHRNISIRLTNKVLFSQGLSFEYLCNVIGVDGPEKRDEKTIDNIHDGLDMNHTISLFIEISKHPVFDNQSHEGSSEEETQAIFDTEGELKCLRTAFSLKISEFMEEIDHDKFIEKHYCKDRSIH